MHCLQNDLQVSYFLERLIEEKLEVAKGHRATTTESRRMKDTDETKLVVNCRASTDVDESSDNQVTTVTSKKEVIADDIRRGVS